MNAAISFTSLLWIMPLVFSFICSSHLTCANITFNTLHYPQPTEPRLLTFPPVLSHSCSLSEVLQYQSTQHSIGTHIRHTIWNPLPPALRSCDCPTLSDITSRLITSRKLFHPLYTSLIVPQIWHLLTLCTFINFIYLLTLCCVTLQVIEPKPEIKRPMSDKKKKQFIFFFGSDN